MINLYKSKQSSIIIALISVTFVLSLSCLIYIYYLQAFGFSLKRIVFGFVIVALLSFLFYKITWLVTRKFFFESKPYRALGFWLFIAVLLSPNLLPIPHYPTSPLFRPTSNIQIKIQIPGDGNESIRLKGVWLTFDNQQYSSSDFQISGNWVNDSGKIILISGSEVVLTWRGKIGERARLTIFPMDKAAYVTVLWDGEKESFSLTNTAISLVKKSATPFEYYLLITIAKIIITGYFLFVFLTGFSYIKNVRLQIAVVWIFLLSLCLITVYLHFQSTDITDKFDIQMGYHQSVIFGTALSPSQYRVFSEWLIEGLAYFVSLFNSNQPYYLVFTIVRLLQNVLIYSLSYLYYRKLGYSRNLTLVGIVFVTGALLNSFYKSGFSINTYFDVIFYLIGSMLIMNYFYSWLPLLMLVASLNRETSGLIPFLALSIVPIVEERRPKIIFALFALFIWGVVFIILRFLYPARELFIPYGHPPGISLLLYNLSPASFGLLFRFFSVVPILGLIVCRHWPQVLKRFFIVLIPVWFLIHLFASVIAETRLFLVPEVLIFIPSFLIFLQLIWRKIFQRSDELEETYVL